MSEALRRGYVLTLTDTKYSAIFSDVKQTLCENNLGGSWDDEYCPNDPKIR